MGAHSAGQHAKRRTLLDEIYELLKKTDEAEYVVQAHHAAGSQMHAEGNLRRARDYIGQCLSAYRIDTHGNLAMTYGGARPRLLLAGNGSLDVAHARIPGPGQ